MMVEAGLDKERELWKAHERVSDEPPKVLRWLLRLSSLKWAELSHGDLLNLRFDAYYLYVRAPVIAGGLFHPHFTPSALMPDLPLPNSKDLRRLQALAR